MKYASKTEKLKAVTFKKDWKNLSETAGVKAGTEGFVTAKNFGSVDVIFPKEQENNVKPNIFNYLGVTGVPLSELTY